MIKNIKQLRDQTNVSLNACKKALEDSNGDLEQALILLQKRGQMKANEKSGKPTSEGKIYSYVHQGRVGVMVEVSCETDFNAKSKEFTDFCEFIALQIAAANPSYLLDVPESVTNQQKEIFAAQVQDKPEKAREKIVEGKLVKWRSEIVLMEQQSITDPKKAVEDIRAELVQKTQENIVVKRFIRWELGA